MVNKAEQMRQNMVLTDEAKRINAINSFGETYNSNFLSASVEKPDLTLEERQGIAFVKTLMTQNIREIGINTIVAAYQERMYRTGDFPIEARKVLDRHILEQKNAPKKK